LLNTGERIVPLGKGGLLEITVTPAQLPWIIHEQHGKAFAREGLCGIAGHPLGLANKFPTKAIKNNQERVASPLLIMERFDQKAVRLIAEFILPTRFGHFT